MSTDCKHPTCFDSPTCRREKKPKKVYSLPRQSKPINKVSKKQSKALKIYETAREVYLEQHPACGVCGGIADQIHHKAGRLGDLLLDTTKWLSVCMECHRWIEEAPLQAKEMGYSESRLAG